MTSTLRDATHAELRDEPDVVLQALVDGTMTATWVTREIAKHELAERNLVRGGTYDFASYGVTAAIAAIERQQRPVLYSVPCEAEAPAALRTAKAAYDRRHSTEGA